MILRSQSNVTQQLREQNQSGYQNGQNGQNGFNATDEDRTVSIRDNLFAQLDILKSQRGNLHDAPMYDTYKDLYCVQQRLLSTLNNRTTFPRSVAYSAIKFERKPREILQQFEGLSTLNSSSSGRSYPNASRLDGNEELVNLIDINLESYDRLLKSRLNRVPVSKMSKEDHKAIFAAWYQTQKLIEAVEILDKSNCSPSVDPFNNDVEGENNQYLDLEMKKMHDLKCEIIDSVPLHTSTLCSDNILGSKEWLNKSLKNTKDFHDAFNSRAKYLIETGIGRCELRSTLKKMKDCCALERENRVTGRVDMLDEKWISALKYYKAVHTCLVTGASNDASCMFVQKEYT